MNYFRYEDIQVGMEQEYCVRITDDMMERFKDITGDCNPLHTDEKFAEAHGYPKRIAYGMLTASFLSTLAGVYLPGERSLIQSVEIKFVRPVYIGDVLRVLGLVLDINDTVRQFVMKVDITNQKKANVVRGGVKVGVLDKKG